MDESNSAPRRRRGDRQQVQRRHWSELLSVRTGRTQLVAAALLGLLGFALVVQVQQQRQQPFETLRVPELVGLLDQVTANERRLQAERQRLEQEREELLAGSASREEARESALRRSTELGILAGTLPAKGPGVTITIAGVQPGSMASILLDTVQELRDAGAEAIQINDVRVIARTSFADAEASVVVDGTELNAPLRVVAIGDAETLAAAISIPGGLLESLRSMAIDASVAQEAEVTVDALADPQPLEKATAVPAGSISRE